MTRVSVVTALMVDGWPQRSRSIHHVEADRVFSALVLAEVRARGL